MSNQSKPRSVNIIIHKTCNDLPQPDIYEKIEHIATFQLNDLHKRAFIKGRMGGDADIYI